jgi:hypothetical protein
VVSLFKIAYRSVFRDLHKILDTLPAARIFQLLLAGQLPIMAFFAMKWLPKMSRQALQILALQIGAALSAFALVFFLEM